MVQRTLYWTAPCMISDHMATTTASTAYASMVHPGKSTDDPSETTILVSVLTKTLTKNLQEYF